jgi:ketosteroid isomerase-like protein
MRAFNAGDAEGAAGVYDTEGYFMPNGHSPVKGRAGIQKYFQQDMADGVSSAQVSFWSRVCNFWSLMALPEKNLQLRIF